MRNGLILVCVVFTILSCDDKGDNQRVDNFDRGPMLTNMAENIIMPAYADFATKTGALTDSIDLLLDTVTAENLEATQAAWLDAKLSWKYAQIFNFGPVDTELLEANIDYWPTSGVGIENEIMDFDGSTTYLDLVGANKKGLVAVEYILFHADSTTVIGELKEGKRLSYLSAVSKELETNADLILSLWNGGYKSSFVENTGNDVGSSATALANELIMLVEKIKNYKVALPAGISTGGILSPQSVESYYAKESMAMILKNLDAIEDVFAGKAGQGFDDYLDTLALDNGVEKLSSKIIAQIEKCRTTAESIDGPLQDALDAQSATIEQLFIDLQGLTVLMKTDMMSRLGLIVTFSDNDGD
ncbi:imelysin family protein [Marinoscillum sp. MHG1-6]|uniref:imelysin family protein n=1 Tax=Marinoscillum sp. MHG1-6 TaxID=2959627 RepID=UPI002157163C|nr:imelysin family protein [Marinoscillum sp. MHG1-6]